MSRRYGVKSKSNLKTDWISFLLYVISAIAVFTVFSWVFSWQSLNPIFTGLTGAGAFLFRHKPLRKLGFPFYVEVGLIAVIVAFFTLYFTSEVVVPYMGQEQQITKECQPSTMQMKCYTISQENCFTVWRAYKGKCEIYVKENSDPRNLTSLTGPKVDRCQAKEFDKALKSMRVTPVGGVCESFFNELDAKN